MDKKGMIKQFLFEGDMEEQKKKFEIAWDIWENFDDIKREMRIKVLEALINKIKSSKEFSNYGLKDNGFLKLKKWGELQIYKDNWVLDGKVIIKYSVGHERQDYCDMYLGISKYNEEIPFKGNWKNSEDVSSDWKEILTLIESNLSKFSKNWGTNDWWIVWKWFEEPYKGMGQKEFYREIFEQSNIQKGYEAVAQHYFDELLRLKRATEDFIDQLFYSK